MKFLRPGLIAACLALLSGCAGLVFTEADQGQIREVARGTAFSVSLPAIKNSPRPEPKIQGAFLRFLGRRAEESSGREVFEFQADGLGEGDIRIPPPASSAGRAEPEVVIRVRVVSPEGTRMRVN